MNLNKLLRFIIKFYFQNIETINRLLWRYRKHCIKTSTALALYKGCRKRGYNTSVALTLHVGCYKRYIKTNAIKFWLALGIDITMNNKNFL